MQPLLKASGFIIQLWPVGYYVIMFFPLRTLFRRIPQSLFSRLRHNRFVRCVQALGLSLILGATYSLVQMENPPADTNKVRRQPPPNYSTTVVCDSSEIKEGAIRCVDMPNGRKVVIVRHKGKLHAVSGECTYDNSSPLSEGVCFGDKLFCCHHGCAFDIQSGRVQLPPAINDLPRFLVEQRDGKVVLYTPLKMPIGIEPLAQGRDYTDMRKVVIVGNGMAVLGCIQGLRQNGYTGQIQVISKEVELPYNDEVLLKSFTNKYRHSNKISQMAVPRSEKWYKEMGVQFIFNQQIVDIDAKENYPYVLLEDDTKIEYDGLLLATGTDPVVKKISGLSRGENTFLLHQKKDYEELSKRMQQNKIKDLVVLGYNTKSLRFIKTMHEEFPDVTITVIDPNEKSAIEERLGPELSLLLIEDDAKYGVRFYLRLPVERVQRNKQKLKVKMHLNQQVETDAIVMFPNNEIGRAVHLQNSKRVELDMSQLGNIKTDNNCRTSNKQIFAAGKGSTVHYFYGQELLPCLNNRIAYQQGYTAAYNILALNIPYHMIPFQTIQSIGRQIKLVGYNSLYDDIYLIGDVDKWDFVVLYSLTGFIVGCATTPSQKRAAGIFQEAFRQQLLPRMSEFKKGTWSIQKLETAIRRNRKAGCYKDPIDEIRETYKINPRDILWMHRDVEGIGMREADEFAKKPSFIDKDGYVREVQR